MVLGIQIVGTLFGLFMIYYSFLNYKRKQFSTKEFGLWLFLWIAFIVITLFPNLLDPVVVTLNFARTFDLLIILGFIYILLAVFYNYTVTRKNQKQIETIVRELAHKRKRK